jgi:hypothetical protein
VKHYKKLYLRQDNYQFDKFDNVQEPLRSVLSRLLGFGGGGGGGAGGGVKGGEGGENRATFFACLQELLGGGGILRFWGEKSPLTGLDKTLPQHFVAAQAPL